MRSEQTIITLDSCNFPVFLFGLLGIRRRRKKRLHPGLRCCWQGAKAGLLEQTMEGFFISGLGLRSFMMELLHPPKNLLRSF